MDRWNRLSVYMNKELNTNLYQVAGVTTFLARPSKAVQYLKGELEIGLGISFLLAAVAIFLTIKNYNYYISLSMLLPFSLCWLAVTNLMALLPKLFVYKALRAIDIDNPKGLIRASLIVLFRKRCYWFDKRLSRFNVVSYLLSIPISVYLWKSGVTECFDLLIYSVVYILRCYYGIQRYNRYFLDNPQTNDSQYTSRQLIYSPAEVKSTIPKLYGDSCSICMTEYSPGDTLAELKCHGGHFFHQSCINNWMERNNSCPLCKEVIFNNGKEE